MPGRLGGPARNPSGQRRMRKLENRIAMAAWINVCTCYCQSPIQANGLALNGAAIAKIRSCMSAQQVCRGAGSSLRPLITARGNERREGLPGPAWSRGVQNHVRHRNMLRTVKTRALSSNWARRGQAACRDGDRNIACPPNWVMQCFKGHNAYGWSAFRRFIASNAVLSTARRWTPWRAAISAQCHA